MMSWRSGVRAAAVAAAVVGATSAAAPVAAATAFPSLRVFSAQRTVTVTRPRGQRVYLSQLGVYVTPVGGRFELAVRRAGYASPVTIMQVAGSAARRLPVAFTGWDGLGGFFDVTTVNWRTHATGHHTFGFCPDSWDVARVGPSGPLNPTFPTWCASNPFTLGMPWGIDRDWAANAFSGAALGLRDGTYTVTVTVAPAYARALGIAPAAARLALRVDVRTGNGFGFAGRRAAPRPAPFGGTPPAAAPRSLRPDLVPLPAWSIGISHPRGHDVIGFAATVWVGGNGPLVVEGYRRPGTGIMDAFQYFLDRRDHAVGRVPAGTFEWDTRRGHNHWHIQQFARYSLVNASTGATVLSQKQSFCLAPTDAINLLLPRAIPGWPAYGTQCGGESAIWIREALPVGWGDTYYQSVAGQAFDVTRLPNGCYFIEVTANPDGVLKETTTRNDTSRRLLTVAGAPGHRVVTVAPWNGIDA
jgi:hypothetical protein